MRKYLIVLAASVAFAAPAAANTVLFDNFDGENGGMTALNYSGFSNFSTAGNVDLVKTPDYGIVCNGGSGSCVDLDGTPGPGELQTLSSFAFNAGDRVAFSFDLSGSQRGSTENLTFGFRSQGGNIAYNNVQIMSALFGNPSFGNFFMTDLNGQGFGVGTAVPFGNFTLRFTAGNAGSLKAYVGSNSMDNVGVLVDNVSLDISAVPEPASWALMIGGFGLVGGAMRRRAKVNFVTA